MPRCAAAVTIACALISLGPASVVPLAAQDRPVKIVALGDSLTAGQGLQRSETLPEKLMRALAAKGIEVAIVNAGVSGDTASGGLERLNWSVPTDTDAVIVELGANDMMRGIDPKITRAALGAIVYTLRQKRIAVLICGMLATPSLGSDYADEFNLIYPDIAAAYGALYYPFILDGVAGIEKLNQPDRLHPTADGVDVIVRNLLPTIEQLIVWAKSERHS